MAEITQESCGNGHRKAGTSNTNISSLEGEHRLIQKVPPWLRLDKHNECDYDPAVVSFGPYHHGKHEKLELAEDFKGRSLELFVESSRKEKFFFSNKVKEVIQEVRKCYDKSSTAYCDDCFTEMMLRDASFLINFITCLAREKKYPPPDTFVKEVVNHLGSLGVKLIQRDIYLLENQIPFRFLKHLFNLRYGGSEAILDIIGFLGFKEYNKQYRNSKDTGANNNNKDPIHLLESLRTMLVANFEDKEEKCCQGLWKDKIKKGCQCIWKDKEKKGCQGLWKGKVQKGCQELWKNKVKKGCLSCCRPRDLEKNIYSFRSVTDLKAKGIHFRPNPIKSLKAIKFQSGCIYAKLQLPVWHVSIYTKVFFLNMVAFEMSPNNRTDRIVSSYMKFMKSLIDSPEDVKELREHNIIINQLGSDEEVLQVYKDINTYGVNDDAMFKEVQTKIQAHYNSKAKTWLAEFLHTYFRSPWSAIALFAATFILCLTFIQTYFTINPSSDN